MLLILGLPSLIPVYYSSSQHSSTTAYKIAPQHIWERYHRIDRLNHMHVLIDNATVPALIIDEWNHVLTQKFRIFKVTK